MRKVIVAYVNGMNVGAAPPFAACSIRVMLTPDCSQTVLIQCPASAIPNARF